MFQEKFNADFTDFKKMVDILTKKVIEGYMARHDKAKKEEEEEDESSDQLNTWVFLNLKIFSKNIYF